MAPGTRDEKRLQGLCLRLGPRSPPGLFDVLEPDAFDGVLVGRDPLASNLLHRLLLNFHGKNPLVDDIGVQCHLLEKLRDLRGTVG